MTRTPTTLPIAILLALLIQLFAAPFGPFYGTAHAAVDDTPLPLRQAEELS